MAHTRSSSRRDLLVTSCLSGLVWGVLAAVLAHAAGLRPVMGGLIASPVIGLAAGWSTRWWVRLPRALRIAFALLSLYLAALLFGLAVGLWDWLVLAIPGRDPLEVVHQAVLAVLWGLTFTGYVLFFWPLAYLNHWLVARRAAIPRTTLLSP